jgi:beta-N-acetylhexosaminidase
MTFAPACDIKTQTSDKFTIGTRSYSNDPGTAVAISKIFTKSAIKNTILIAPKHAPGLGSVAQDTHFNAASIEKSKNQILTSDMRPFVELFKTYKENIHFVLCPHVIFKDIDSQNISTKSDKFANFIRSNTKQDVLIISDDLSMAAFSDINVKNTTEKAIIETKSDIIIAGIGKSLAEVKQIADLVKKKEEIRRCYLFCGNEPRGTYGHEYLSNLIDRNLPSFRSMQMSGF